MRRTHVVVRAPGAVTRTAVSELFRADPFAGVVTAADVAGVCSDALTRATRLIEDVGRAAGEAGVEVTFAAVFTPLDEVHYIIRSLKGLMQSLADLHPEAAVRDAARDGHTRADKLETSLLLDAAVAAAVKRVAAHTRTEPLDAVSARLLAHTLREIRRNGLDLPREAQAELRELNEQMAELGQAFLRNVTEAQASIEIGPGALAGLPPEVAAACRARSLPNGNVVVTTDYPDLLPFVKFAADRAAARALYAKYDNRAAADNVPLLERLLALRERKAKLLGYVSWAEYAIEPRMAKSPAAVRQFLAMVADAVEAPAAAELGELRAMHEALGGDPNDPLYPSDRYYLEERVRHVKYGYDAKRLAQYFEVTAVRDGLLDLTSRLYGIEYRRAPDATTWHPDVEAYDVWRAGALAGRIFFDLYPRPNKFKHAATYEIRPAWRLPPVGALVCNFPRPGGDGPALLTHDDVVVFFHEFGHLLHEMVSDARYASFSGEAVTRDFVEVPSQVFEEWAYRREVLDGFARHHETGAPIPDELFDALARARRFGKALMTQIQLFLAALDLEYHSRPAGFDTTALLRELYYAHQPFAFQQGTHFQATFSHLVGYDAGYYGYQWALSLAHDILARFRREGFLNATLADEWRRCVLSCGGSQDEAAMVERFLGRPPRPTAYIEHLQSPDDG